MPAEAAVSLKPVSTAPLAASRRSALDALLAILKTPELAADVSGQAEFWTEIKRLADVHRFSGLLAHSTSTWLPASERQWRDQTLMRHHRLHGHRLGALRILGDAFRSERIDVVSLKGPLLAERFYAAPFLRPSNDLDLLIREEDVGRATRLMLKLGFGVDGSFPWKLQHRVVHHLNFDATDFSPRVEMHYDLRAGGHTFEAAGFVDRSVLWRSPSGVEFPALCMADEAFYSCVHAAKHLFHRLRWLYDTITIARGLSASERAETKALAIRHHQTGHFVGAVMAAREFFEEELNLDCAGFMAPYLWNALAPHHTREMAMRVEGTSSSFSEKIGCRLDRLRLTGSPWSAAQFLALQLDIEVRKRWYDLSHTTDPEALLKTLPD